MYSELREVKPKKSLVKFKTQVLLALIPVFGCFIAFFTSVHNIELAKSRAQIFTYYFISVIPIFAIIGSWALLLIFFILVQEIHLMVTLCIISAILMVLSIGFVFLGIEKWLLKDIKF